MDGDPLDLSAFDDEASGSDGVASSDPFGGDFAAGAPLDSTQNTGNMFPSNIDNSGAGISGALSGVLRSVFGASMTQPGGTLNNLGLTDALGNLTSTGEFVIIGGAVLLFLVLK
jgi:hypothetical protein